MGRVAKLQFFGPVVVLLTVGGAEAAAFALARIPTSETLWFINLKIFEVFQKSYYQLNTLWDLPYSQFLLVALPLFAVASYGLLAKRAFPLALASQLSFIYASFLLYCGMISQTPSLTASLSVTASLSNVVVASDTNIYLPLFLIGTCLISFLVSHFQYLSEFLNRHAR